MSDRIYCNNVAFFCCDLEVSVFTTGFSMAFIERDCLLRDV
jgi:hypothetical protein